jgi:hypothetical protein
MSFFLRRVRVFAIESAISGRNVPLPFFEYRRLESRIPARAR